MTTYVPGEAVPGFSRPQVERRYQEYMADHRGEIDIPILCETMWSAGGREAIAAMATFDDLLPLLEKFHKRLLEIEKVALRLIEDE